MPIILALWNANGLSQHSSELKIFLSTNNIDILLISETHFTKKSFFKIPSYSFYQTMHPDGTAHGGSAILIKNTLKHSESIHYTTNEIQATNIFVEDSVGPLLISAIYSPPKHNIKKDLYIDFFKSLGNRFIAGGDYNAKNTFWGSRLTSTKGRELYNAIRCMNLTVFSTGEPTYWPSDQRKIPDLIDFCVAKGISNERLVCKNSLDLSSDHSPVIITLDKELQNNLQKCHLHNKKTNWTHFKTILSSKLNVKMPLKSEEEIIEATEYLTECIQEAAWMSTPSITLHTKSHFKVNHSINEKIKEKRLARKIWQRTRFPEDKRRLNKASKDLKILIQSQKEHDLECFLRKLDTTQSSNYSLWKANKKVNSTISFQSPLRKHDNTWAKTPIEKAEVFANHLKTVFSINDERNELENENAVTNFLQETHQMELPIRKFTRSEITAVISRLKDGKAPGYDLITPKVLKELPNEAIIFIMHLFNACITKCIFPAQWKVAEIKMILKPGKPGEDVKSYRPISLLPILGKVFETLFLKRLMPIIESKAIIPSHQFGFRRQHSTIEQIHRLVEKIQTALDRKEYCTAAFLDIAQAFDRVWHKGLFYKAKKVLPINFYSFIKSYLSQRQFFVKVEDEMSSLYPIEAGVPQGSVLGPILYLLFTHDLPTTTEVLTGTFADDTAIVTSSDNPKEASSKLQKNLDEISHWLKRWRMRANEAKSVHVTFTTRRETCPQIKLNDVPIPQSDNAKYLGMHLDRRLTWKSHILTKRKSLGIKYREMFWLLSRQSSLSLENKIILYNSILKPIWTYGIQLWGTAAKSSIEIIQRFQSKTLRTMVNAPWYVTNAQIHRDLKIPFVKDEINAIITKYRDRIDSHPNELASSLMSPSKVFTRLKRKTPLQLTTHIFTR